MLLYAFIKLGNTALHHAIESGTVDIMQLLLEHASDDINNKGELGWTLLHHAACYGNTEKAEILIQNGADLNPRPIDKSSTPLHVAAIYGSLSMIKLMLENKSDVNAVDLEGISPIHSATRYGTQLFFSKYKVWNTNLFQKIQDELFTIYTITLYFGSCS